MLIGVSPFFMLVSTLLQCASGKVRGFVSRWLPQASYSIVDEGRNLHLRSMDSRDALRKYYTGSILLLGLMEKEQNDDERQAPSRPQQANPDPPDDENAHSDDRRLGGFEPGNQEPGDASQGLDR